ncbi:hypothetical protein [Acinetobacter bereziniae]|uniref:hypothetical protein n=1 Tax=Acinetobacter bereziniae TaxID=106648 RepID=UPI001D18A66D|nr:hypothetical protein [Acinetobacter bereziniae]
MILLCALINCAAFAASPTAKQSIEKQSKLTIKPHLQNKSQHHQRLKTTVPPIKPAPRILETIPKDPNSTEPRRIIDIAPTSSTSRPLATSIVRTNVNASQ